KKLKVHEQEMCYYLNNIIFQLKHAQNYLFNFFHIMIQFIKVILFHQPNTRSKGFSTASMCAILVLCIQFGIITIETEHKGAVNKTTNKKERIWDNIWTCYRQGHGTPEGLSPKRYGACIYQMEKKSKMSGTPCYESIHNYLGVKILLTHESEKCTTSASI
ncbi:hypothetical protein ACJX0J_017252, partial [Zea mays]